MKYTILILALLFSTHFMNAQFENQPYISVQGEATEYIVPNEILLTISVDEKAGSLEEVRRNGTSKIRKIIDFLKSQDIEERHIQTQFQNIGTVLKRPNYVELDYFQYRQSINVCLTEIEHYDAILDGLIALGIYNVGSPNFRSTELDDAKLKARNAAMLNAKTKAEQLASQLGQKIGKALFIQDNPIQNRGNGGAYMRAEASNMSFDSGPSIATGQLVVEQKVTVYFELF